MAIAVAENSETETKIDEKAVVQKRGLGFHGYGDQSGFEGGIIVPAGHFQSLHL